MAVSFIHASLDIAEPAKDASTSVTRLGLFVSCLAPGGRSRLISPTHIDRVNCQLACQAI